MTNQQHDGPMDGIQANIKITKARVQMVMAHPFFATLALKMRMVPAPGLTDPAGQETPMAVDGFNLFYRPDLVDGLTVENTKFLMALEVMRCACLHHLRRGDRDPGKWQMASYHAVRPLLDSSECGIAPDNLPQTPKSYHDKAAEEIYTLLPDGEGPGKGQGQAAAGIVMDSPAPPSRGQGSGEGQKQPQQGQGQGQGEGEGEGEGEQDPQPGQGQAPSQAEKNEMESEWKLSVAQAAQAAKSIGKLPSNLERFAEAMIAAKIDWREQLRRFMVATKEDYQWLPPNRRHVWRGVYLPGLRSEGIKRAAFGVDTSGSIGPDELAEFATEISGVLSEFPGCEITVIYCDAQVANVERFTHDDLPLKLDARGGGGTAFEPVFNYIAKEDIEPDFVIYLTDLYGDTQFEAPDYPVLWVTTGRQDAAFGEVIVLREEGSRY